MKYRLKKFRPVVYLFLLVFALSCGGDDCKYIVVEDDLIPPGCTLVSSINFSTGLDADGNLIAPGTGVTDPFWRVLNKPPLIFCDDNPLLATINGNAYVVNFGNFDNVNWVNQPTASTLAPADLGTENGFGCNNPVNADGIQVPYVFERSFCVLEDTQVNFEFSFKGDDQIYFELYNNNTNAVLSTSINYIYPAVPFIWTETALPLDAGSYSIRGYLINTSSVVLGMSFSGSMETVNGQLAISNNVQGCCENNTISVLNVLESAPCDQTFNGADLLGVGWTFKLKDTSGKVLRTIVANANGNVFFAGLDDGTYIVETTALDGYTVSSPIGGSITVSVANNQVQIVEFYSCQ